MIFFLVVSALFKSNEDDNDCSYLQCKVNVMLILIRNIFFSCFLCLLHSAYFDGKGGVMQSAGKFIILNNLISKWLSVYLCQCIVLSLSYIELLLQFEFCISSANCYSDCRKSIWILGGQCYG